MSIVIKGEVATPPETQDNRVTRPPLLRVVGEVLKPNNFPGLSEILLGRLNPSPIIDKPQEVIDVLNKGRTLVLAYPHIWFGDVPFAYAAIHMGQEPAPTKLVVAKNPPPFAPPDSFDVWFHADDIRRPLKSGIGYNQFAAIGNLLLNRLAMGGMFRKGISDKNNRMIEDAATHLGEGGNIGMWPSGPDMIGKWHNGCARIILDNMNRYPEEELNIVFVHSSTFPNSIAKGLVSESRFPAIMSFKLGPSLQAIKDWINQEDMQSSPRQVATNLMYKLAGSFLDQEEEFIKLVSSADRTGKRIASVRRNYDVLRDTINNREP